MQPNIFVVLSATRAGADGNVEGGVETVGSHISPTMLNQKNFLPTPCDKLIASVPPALATSLLFFIPTCIKYRLKNFSGFYSPICFI